MKQSSVKIAILGWGSLLWEERPEFDEFHGKWEPDGPSLPIEFSRVSKTRHGALTLVLDTKKGTVCQFAYALSTRKNPNDAICDLRCREGTNLKNIGYYFADESQKQVREEEILDIIKDWASKKKIDVVIWTDLESNFEKESKCENKYEKFLDAALCHIQALDDKGKAKAAEYVWRAPTFVKTPLRDELQSRPWFQKHR